MAYYYTRAKAEGEDKDAVGRELSEIVLEIVRRAESIGLRVNSVTCDMGPENAALWRYLGISCTRYGTSYAIQHPVRPNDLLCFIADVPHLFKSLRKMLMANEVVYLPDDIVQEEGLPTNVVQACHFCNLLNAESKFELVAPRLNENSLVPKGRFTSMKVGTARSVLNRRTATGLQLLALHTQDPSYITAAWFVNHVNKWFELMTSRCHKVALSKRNAEQYEEALDHLRKTIRLFRNMKIGASGHWKPCQTGVIVATESILHLQDLLLNQRGFRFVLTSRFTQDFLENLFSSIRARQKVPNALTFKNILKVVTIAQYCRRCPGSSYDLDESDFLLDLPEYARKREAEKQAAAAEVSDTSLAITRAYTSDIQQLPIWERYVMYDLAGAVLASVKKLMKVCDTCFQACLHKGPQPHPYNTIIQLLL